MRAMTVKVLKWGNSFGLRVRKTDAERLGLVPGTALRISFQPTGKAHDLDALPSFDLGGSLSRRHDEMWGDGA